MHSHLDLGREFYGVGLARGVLDGRTEAVGLWAVSVGRLVAVLGGVLVGGAIVGIAVGSGSAEATGMTGAAVGVPAARSSAVSLEISLRRCKKRSIRSERRLISSSSAARPASAVAKSVTESRLACASVT